MTTVVHRKSQIYGTMQTVLLFAFAAAFLFDIGPWLFAPEGWRIFANSLCGIGILLMLIALISLRKVIQIAPEPRAGSLLVTSGIYRWFRHPIYTAILILVVGLFLKKPTMGVAIAAAVVIVFLFIKARFEEELLVTHYLDYDDYKKRAWGIVPGFHR